GLRDPAGSASLLPQSRPLAGRRLVVPPRGDLLLPQSVRSAGNHSQCAARPGVRGARVAPADQPVGDRDGAGVPALSPARPGVEGLAPRVQCRNADHDHRREPRARLHRAARHAEDGAVARARSALAPMTSDAPIAGSASTTPAVRTPADDAIAPSTRLASGRTPRNAMPQSAMIRPRCDSATSSWSRLVADVFEAR